MKEFYGQSVKLHSAHTTEDGITISKANIENNCITHYNKFPNVLQDEQKYCKHFNNNLK